MQIGDTLLIFFVIFWTILLMFIPYILGLRKQMINDWSTYRCHPLILPIAGLINKENGMSTSDATTQNFEYCTQNIVSNTMGSLLEPLNAVTSQLSDTGGGILDSLNFVRGIISNIRTFFTSIIDSIFGIFINIIIEFIKIFVGIRDIMGKLVGAILTFIYLLDGVGITGESAYNGYIKEIFNDTDALCFHPNTLIRKKNGSLCKISKLLVGDEIDGNSRIIQVLKLNNTMKECFYSLNNILVTGSHLIYYQSKYIPVHAHPNAKKTEQYSDILYCLVTDNHIIQINDLIFHDWEDDDERNKYNKMRI